MYQILATDERGDFTSDTDRANNVLDQLFGSSAPPDDEMWAFRQVIKSSLSLVDGRFSVPEN